MDNSNSNSSVAGKTIRRKFSRIDEKVSLQYRIRDIDEGRESDEGYRVSVNIGGGGLLFSVDEPMPISTILNIEIDLPASPIPMSAVGRVVRVEETAVARRYDVGVEFLEICDEDKKALEEFIRDRLEIDIKFEDAGGGKGTTVIRLKGFLDAGTVQLFERAVNALMGEGRSKIVLDCAGLDYMSSDGIMMFLSTAAEAKKKGGSLKIASVVPQILDVLELAEVTRFLDIFDTEEEALKSFESAN